MSAYSDELRAEIERQIHFRKLPPSFLDLVVAFGNARFSDGRFFAQAEELRLRREENAVWRAIDQWKSTRGNENGICDDQRD